MAIAYRTFSPKVSHYVPDGGGRDGYVSCDSGGMLHVSSPPREGSATKSSHYYSPKRAQMDAKPLKYHSDGTGRDGYIM